MKFTKEDKGYTLKALELQIDSYVLSVNKACSVADKEYYGKDVKGLKQAHRKIRSLKECT